MHQVIDDFLDQRSFNEMVKTFLPFNFSSFDWYYTEIVTTGNKGVDLSSTGYFIHNLFNVDRPENDKSSKYFPIIFPILDKLNIHAMLRAKVNLYPRTTNIEEHVPHVDYTFPHKSCIMFLNDCNGFTRLVQEKVDSISNRLLMFDGDKIHNSSSCTDKKFRLTLNINYID